MLFRVSAASRDGARETFVREAGDGKSLASSLRAAGYAVLSIEPAVRPAKDGPRGFSLFPRRMRKIECETGLRQLASMLKSGITLLAALETVSEQSRTRRAARIWSSVAAKISSGSTLADALASHSGTFGPTCVRLAEIGEKSGELEKTLSRAADQMESRRNLGASVANALAYPLVAIAMAAGVCAFLVVSVIPKIASFLEGSGAELPAITRMLVDFSAWTAENGIRILACAGAAAAVWLVLRAKDAGRELEDAFLLKLPVAGRILRLSGTALFARAMQIMSESGVSLVDALDGAARMLPNKRLARRVADARGDVLRGSTLAAALGKAVEFMPMLPRMAAVGEASGTLPESFGETARFHEAMLALSVRRFAMAIEPIMIIATGAIVGFVYVAFFAALFSIAGAA